jgi:hypothetical protein
MEAKARGTTVIHADPRFTRTSAVADLHVPVRAGSDIAFLGAIINYVLARKKHFRDYVVAYTNAAAILTEDFADTEDLDGVFSGLDREHRTYDFRTWQYDGLEVQAASGERDKEYQDRAATREAARGEEHGSGGAGLPSGTPERDDETLQHPRCAFQGGPSCRYPASRDGSAAAPGAGSIAAPARLPRPALAAPAGSSRRRATAAAKVDPMPAGQAVRRLMPRSSWIGRPALPSACRAWARASVSMR